MKYQWGRMSLQGRNDLWTGQPGWSLYLGNAFARRGKKKKKKKKNSNPLMENLAEDAGCHLLNTTA